MFIWNPNTYYVFHDEGIISLNKQQYSTYHTQEQILANNGSCNVSAISEEKPRPPITKISLLIAYPKFIQFPGDPWLKMHICIAAKVLLFELFIKVFKMYIKIHV